MSPLCEIFFHVLHNCTVHQYYQNTFLLFQLMQIIIKIIECLKQFKITTLPPTCFGSRRNHNQGAVKCLAKTTKYGLSVLVGTDAVNVMAAYQPVVQACGSPHTCTTGWHAAITLTVSIQTSTEKPFCSFSQAQDCSLMIVAAWTETCRGKCYNFKLF